MLISYVCLYPVEFSYRGITLLYGITAMASVITDRPTNLYALSKAHLERMPEEHPHLAAIFHQFIVTLLAERQAFSNQTIEHLLH